MPIENRDLAAGTRLVARYKKQDRTCEVVETPDGLRYRLDDGTEHKSPSSAGKAAMDGVACNGWRFWSIAGTETPKREPKAEKAGEGEEGAGGEEAGEGEGREEGQEREEAEGQGDAGEGDGRRFVRLRRVRRDVRVAEGGGRPRADAHQLTSELLARAAGRESGLLSSTPEERGKRDSVFTPWLKWIKWYSG